MSNEQRALPGQQDTQDKVDDKSLQPQQNEQKEQARKSAADAFDALADKKPEELTPEELRLMADTMPGEGPGD